VGDGRLEARAAQTSRTTVWQNEPWRPATQTVAPFALLVPVFGLSFGALLLDEPVTGRDVAAAVLVLGGVLLTLRARWLAISPLVAESPPGQA